MAPHVDSFGGASALLRARVLAVLASSAAIALAACGGPAASLFGVQRSGTVPGANLQVVPSDDGTVKCNGRSHELPDPLLLTAEDLADALGAPASKGLNLPSGPHPIYTYVVATPSGTLSYSDESPHETSVMRHLAAWVLTVAKTVCA
jgi:hypothetical protein